MVDCSFFSRSSNSFLMKSLSLCLKIADQLFFYIVSTRYGFLSKFHFYISFESTLCCNHWRKTWSDFIWLKHNVKVKGPNRSHQLFDNVKVSNCRYILDSTRSRRCNQWHHISLQGNAIGQYIALYSQFKLQLIKRV